MIVYLDAVMRTPLKRHMEHCLLKPLFSKQDYNTQVLIWDTVVLLGQNVQMYCAKFQCLTYKVTKLNILEQIARWKQKNSLGFLRQRCLHGTSSCFFSVVFLFLSSSRMQSQF